MRVKHHTLTFWAATLGLALALFWSAGCGLPGSQPHIMVKQWTLEYQVPQPAPAKLAAGIKLARFQADQAYLGPEMIYRPAPNERGIYHYNRWLASPADLVGDFLLRDLRAEGALSAVYSNRQPQRPRFKLEGGVEEFLEVDSEEAWHATLKVNFTLLDTKQKQVTKRLLFQRTYSFTSKMPEKNPAGLARAMSQAVAEFSAKARSDIYEAINKALDKPLPKDSGR